MTEWQPIETAPKDGSVILIAGGNMGYEHPTIASAMWDDGWHLDQWESPNECAQPAHWMPLPASPQGTK